MFERIFFGVLNVLAVVSPLQQMALPGRFAAMGFFLMNAALHFKPILPLLLDFSAGILYEFEIGGSLLSVCGDLS